MFEYKCMHLFRKTECIFKYKCHKCMHGKICIWHCFLVDKGSDRYASPDTGRAEGLYIWPSRRPVSATSTHLGLY